MPICSLARCAKNNNGTNSLSPDSTTFEVVNDMDHNEMISLIGQEKLLRKAEQPTPIASLAGTNKDISM